jgi:hypothetical protein
MLGNLKIGIRLGPGFAAVLALISWKLPIPF